VTKIQQQELFAAANMQLCSILLEIKMFDDPDDIVVIGCVVAAVAGFVIVYDIAAIYNAAITFLQVAP
jgi:hypothetical protein